MESYKMYKDYLDKMISNKTTSYKLFWIKGIIFEIINGKKEITFKEAASRIISEMYKPILNNEIKFNATDQLDSIIYKLKGLELIDEVNSKEYIYERILNFTEKEVEEQLSIIYKYAPYRLLTPFYEDDLRGKPDGQKNKIIEEKSQNDDEVFYKLYGSDKRVVINDGWFNYIRENENSIVEWIDSNISDYIIKINDGEVFKNVSKSKGESKGWVLSENNNEKFIGRRILDSAFLNNGTVLPKDKNVRERFLNNLSEELLYAESRKVDLILEGKVFKCTIDRPRSHSEESMYVRIKFLREIKNFILDKLDRSSYNYIDFYIDDKKDLYRLELIKGEGEVSEEHESIEEQNIIKDFKVDETIDFIYDYITSLGYTYNKSLIKNIYLSLKTKPFLILSGISGTGKSKIIELFAGALGASVENKRFNLIPVKPDWSDSTDLLGYRNIEGKFTPGVITKICYEAMINKDVPYFIVLDEMNLARVEYYFSDILSLMETRRVNEEGEILTNNLLNKDMLEGTDSGAFIDYWDVYIPENVYIIGTVNMDETTFSFSRKVLDRANTIEFNKVDLNYDFDRIFAETEEPRVLHNDFLKSDFLKIKDCSAHKEIAAKTINKLIEINSILEKYNFHFAYRVRDEIVFYMIYAISENILSFDEAMDNCIVQKILPKINGSSNECYEVLVDLLEYFNDIKLEDRDRLDDRKLDGILDKINKSHTSEKIVLMIKRFIKDSFTSFW